MHPIFARPGRLVGYLGAAVVFAALLAALLHLASPLSWQQSFELAGPLVLFFDFVCLTPWYTCRYLPLRSTRPLRIVLNHFGAAVLATALWVGLARLIGQALGLGDAIKLVMVPLIAVGLLLYSLSVALHYTVLAVQASREAEIQARDAQLRALKAQINPHFLFNSLNSITALTGIDPPQAREMCIRLSDFLRNTLGLGEKESIPWRDELALARTYLEVERVRFGSRLQVEMHVEEACGDCMVPPLVLQPLIENAVKHGIATLVDGGTIRVEGRLYDGLLEISVENGFDPDSPAPRRHGHGLRNVRERLETRFGSAASLTAHADQCRFRAEMIVPCRREGVL